MVERNVARVVELRAENFKRLQAIVVRPEAGAAVVVGGRNGQGKSSALDAIAAALGGARHCPSDPIRHGAESAEVVVDLGDLVVRRRWTPGGSRLEVETPDGGLLRSPQAVLDRLVGEISFDPLAFTRQAPKAQAETLRQLAGLDLEVLDGKLARAERDRTEAGREVKRLDGAVSSLGRDVEAPAAEVSVSDLLAELGQRERLNSIHEARGKVAERDKDALGDLRRRIASDRQAREKAIADIEAKLADARSEDADVRVHEDADEASARAQAEASCEEYARSSGADEAEIRARLARVEQDNAGVRANAERAKLRGELEQARAKVEQLTAGIEALRTERRKAIEGAAYPIEGLLVDDGGVTYRGVPLEQASSAEQIRVSAAIGLALNPRLRVLLIREGSLLDADSFAALVEQAAAADAQIWLERVGEGAGVSVVIEDGEVRSP